MDEVDARLVRALESVRNRSTHAFATPEDLAQITHPRIPHAPASHRVRPSSDFVLLGAPGSGKGTQAVRLAAEFHLPHIATGDLFRDNLRAATPLGLLAKAYMDRGELVPDDITEAMVEERLGRADARNGFILDGFPRSVPQAQALTEMLAREHRRLAGVIHLRVPDDAIVMRLSGRMICRQCQAPYHSFFKAPKRPGVCDTCGGELYQRGDDTADTVRNRLATFHAQTEPLIAHYRTAGLLHEIDGSNDVNEVTVQAAAALRPLLRHLVETPAPEPVAISAR